jgi:hypothetical protein
LTAPATPRAAQKRAGEVHVEDAPPFLLTDVEERVAWPDPSCVHQDVDRASAGDRARNHRGHLVGSGNVRLDYQELRAHFRQRCSRGAGAGFVDVTYRDRGALAGQAEAQRAPDAGASSRDERHLAGELACHCVLA